MIQIPDYLITDEKGELKFSPKLKDLIIFILILVTIFSIVFIIS